MDKLPDDSDRVLAFSPVYKWGDPVRYRLLEGQFVKICREITKWISLKDLGLEGDESYEKNKL